MRNVKWILLAVATAAGLPGLTDDTKGPKPPSDAEIKLLLIGKWEGADLATGVTGTIRYAEDGTFSADGLVPIGNRKIEINTVGTWSVSGGTILSTVTKSSRPRIAPVGTEVKEAVHAIDQKAIRFTRGAEQERVRTRVKE